MPRNKGTSRKGKPGKNERAAGMGKALQRAHGQRYRPRADGKNRRGEGGMAMQAGVDSVGMDASQQATKTMSVLEMNDLDDFLMQADMAHREFASEREDLVVVDQSSQAYRPSAVKWADQKTDFVFAELSVPRRPAWEETTTAPELQRREEETFLEWRRGIAAKEEELMRTSSSSAATPFEKNLEVWRQLWRVLERSSCLLQLVDARNPLFYLSDDLRDYAKSLGKPMMVLVNKSDYLSPKQRQTWFEYLSERGWDPVFFSAVLEQQKLDDAAQQKRREEEVDPRLQEHDESESEQDKSDADDSNSEASQEARNEKHVTAENQESLDGRGVDVPLTRKQLTDAMLDFARKHSCQPDERYGNRIQFGMVGFPNVGKSSVINALMGSSKHSHGVVRVGVASQPGKTKHFQTLLLTDDMMLCDCPGLVFPSFVSNTADLVAAGVYPIAQMRNHWPVTQLICQRIPREILNAQYGIQIPLPDEEVGDNDAAQAFLQTLCVARGMLAAASGVPDYTRAARLVIQDYATGKLLYCHAPPDCEDVTAFERETLHTALQNARKLRDKLLQQQQKAAAEKESAEANEIDGVDDDLLELLGGDGGQPKNRSGNSSKPGTSKKKWGKKGRKNRNKDPYGCHSTPDEEILTSSSSSSSSLTASGGVVVNAGKYGRKGYTRPTTYAGARSASK